MHLSSLLIPVAIIVTVLIKAEVIQFSSTFVKNPIISDFSIGKAQV